MMKNIFKAGLKLFIISAIYRIISFLIFSYSWQWNSSLVRVIEVILGIGFLSIWLVYGIIMKLGFIKGLLVGIIGAGDAIILMIISLFTYMSSTYYFGPLEMVIWNISLLQILDMIKISSSIIVYLAPIFAMLLTAIGSCIQLKSKVEKIH